MPQPTLAENIAGARADATAKITAYADRLDSLAVGTGADVSGLTASLRGLVADEPSDAPDAMPGRLGAPTLMSAIDQAEATLTAALDSRQDMPADRLAMARDEIRTAIDHLPKGRDAAAAATALLHRLTAEHGPDSAVSHALTSSWMREFAASRGQPGLFDVAVRQARSARSDTPAAAALAALGEARAFALAAADLARQRAEDRRHKDASQRQPAPHRAAARAARQARGR